MIVMIVAGCESPDDRFQRANELREQEAFSRAVAIYAELATTGHADAMFTLGQMYLNGNGVEEDGEKATELIREAATSGVVDAQVSLGSLHRLGTYVDEDMAEALRWWRLAAEQGNG